MAEFKFETISRSEGRFPICIRAKMENPNMTMHLFLDDMTGKVLYPVEIKPEDSDIVIKLNTDKVASCTFPVNVFDRKIDAIVDHLSHYHEVVAAARELVKAEQMRERDS